jgi:hypothetical protein
MLFLVFSQMSVITVRASDDLLWTVLVEMLLQETFLKLGAAIVDAEYVTIFATFQMFL